MNRDDLLFLISMIWFFGLCGTAAWVFFH